MQFQIISGLSPATFCWYNMIFSPKIYSVCYQQTEFLGNMLFQYNTAHQLMQAVAKSYQIYLSCSVDVT